MTPAAWKPSLIVAGLLLLLTHLWMQSRSPDLDRRTRLHDALRTLELHDAKLMRDVLLARAGLLPNYDALTRTGQDMLRLSRSLQAEFRPDSDGALQALVASADTLASALQEKLALVEHFKSDNALLRNSVMYFDLAGRTLRSHASPRAAGEIAHLWQAMLGFVETVEPGLAQDIQGELDRLVRVRSLPEQAQALIIHGRLIVEVLPQLDALMREIIGTPIAARVGVLQDALQEYGRQVELRAQRFRLLLYLVAVVLVGYLLYQFVRIRASTLALRRAHACLQQESAERRQAEDSLRESEERLRAMTESAHEAIVAADSVGNIVSWNRGATAMFGYSTDDVRGTRLLGLLTDRHQAEQARIFTEACPVAAPVTLTGVRKDSTEFPLELSLSNWWRGTELYVTAIMRDISARKRLEETTRQQELKLIQASKMTALGTLVSCVAHEINNPNQLILMNSGLLSDAWSDALDVLESHHREAGGFTLGGLPYDEMRQAVPVLVHDIYDGAKRIERIVADLKDFARPRVSSGTTEAFSLNDAVQRALRLLGHLIGRKTARLQTDLAESLSPLRGDAQQVEQVVVNLLVNALEALPTREHGVYVSTFAPAADAGVVLEIRDEGIGIAPEHLEQLCDPFFTTKQASGGTGLGLAITQSLVQAHGGQLDFSSERGKGTVARVLFPEG
ncbi:MAG: domain S-box protein [Proteobacteria bacterium]|nr:domain S-box protein [Pseudomonadota bacterium]